MTERKLIGNDKIIVALDTSVARKLAFAEDSPRWVCTFAEMAKNGYAFCLSDAAAMELLIQVRSGKTPDLLHQRMVERLAEFLYTNVPMLPGGIDALAMIGASERPLDVGKMVDLSVTAWRLLMDPTADRGICGPPLEEIRADEQRGWVEWVGRVSAHARLSGIDLEASSPNTVAEYFAELAGPGLDRAAPSMDPPVSVRRHLEMRHRFRLAARSALRKQPYDPTSKRKKNDAIDLDLFTYLSLPGFVLTEDNGFFGSLEGIDSFQRAWFWKPEDLAARWQAGPAPKPVWPEPTGDDC